MRNAARCAGSTDIGKRLRPRAYAHRSHKFRRKRLGSSQFAHKSSPSKPREAHVDPYGLKSSPHKSESEEPSRSRCRADVHSGGCGLLCGESIAIRNRNGRLFGIDSCLRLLLGEFALGQALGGEAHVFLEGNGSVTLARGVEIAPMIVALLLLVAKCGRVLAIGFKDLAQFFGFGGERIVGADGVLGAAGAMLAVVDGGHGGEGNCRSLDCAAKAGGSARDDKSEKAGSGGGGKATSGGVSKSRSRGRPYSAAISTAWPGWSEWNGVVGHLSDFSRFLEARRKTARSLSARLGSIMSAASASASWVSAECTACMDSSGGSFRSKRSRRARSWAKRSWRAR